MLRIIKKQTNRIIYIYNIAYKLNRYKIFKKDVTLLYI